MKNKMLLKFDSLSQNEQFARVCVAGFIMSLNPNMEALNDVKTAVCEAVTNCIVHGYPDTLGVVTIECEIEDDIVHIKISDDGVGIENLDKALKPDFTTKNLQEHSGMGFTIMQTFMDKFSIKSALNEGTTIFMSKKIG